jgi:predicted permease
MIFTTTLSQMAFLFSLIIIGYILAKLDVVPKNAEASISKLETNVFVPALVLGTFMNNFTVEKLTKTGNIFLVSIAIEAVVLPLSLLLVRLVATATYTRNIYTYGLCFSNFGFMGNAVVKALYPEIFLEYLLFTIVLWIAIYMWGVPMLLMDHESGKPTIKSRLKNFLNPMFIAMIIGMIIGLTGLKLPGFVNNAVTTLGDCMSPLAMILTGITVARINLIEILKKWSIYAVTFIRLIAFPLVFVLIARLLNIDRTMSLLALCSLAMPLGLNTVVIPASFGKDTKVASGMALISHLLSCLTIPLIFWLFDVIIPV